MLSLAFRNSAQRLSAQATRPLASLRRPFSVSRCVLEDASVDKILIANRGEIACRVMRTCKRMGIKTVAIYSDADQNALHVRLADEAVNVGPAPTSKSYLSIPNIIQAIKATGAQAVHPGYGFLSENSKFVKALDDIGVTFIGPSESSMAAMGDKIESKILAKKSGVNTIPGYNGVVKDSAQAIEIAKEIGYPVMLKASAGGGGKGMRIAWNDDEVKINFKLAKNEAMSSFGDDRLLVEKFIDNPRHIEIQFIGDKHGNSFYLPERECSIQRRNQKVIEEAPSVHIDQATREAMGEQAVLLAKAVGYYSAGTVEFLVDSKRNFYFLEMNTRLQVEHPITEYITGLDLVELMIRVAAGQKLNLDQQVVNKPKGWAFESRVYAEDPEKFLPSIGRLNTYIEPTGGSEVRCDSGVLEGSEISIYYDPMICKLVVYGEDRPTALGRMAKALDSYVIKGVTHNIPLLREVINHPRFISGKISTKFLAEEFPGGFAGHKLSTEEQQKLLSVAGWIFAQRDIRNRSWLDREVPIPSSWDLFIDINQKMTSTAEPEHVRVELTPQGDFKITAAGTTSEVAADWAIDSPLVNAYVNDQELAVQFLDILPLGFRLSFLGTKYDFTVKTKNQHKYSKYMKEKPKLDVNKLILSPMPGSVVSVGVKVGDVITEGAEVAVVEAMKMQNVLRSHQAGRVKAVNVKEGSNVQANEIMVEIEDVVIPK